MNGWSQSAVAFDRASTREDGSRWQRCQFRPTAIRSFDNSGFYGSGGRLQAVEGYPPGGWASRYPLSSTRGDIRWRVHRYVGASRASASHGARRDRPGWRKNEILQLTWDEIDWAGGLIRLAPQRSKTLVSRILPLSPPLTAALTRRQARRDPASPLVFHRDGLSVRRWRTAWRTACGAAGVPTRFLHDCRRTTARNLIRAGVAERLAMLLTGHKSRAIFDRYHIVNEQELRGAGAQLARYLARQAGRPATTGPGGLPGPARGPRPPARALGAARRSRDSLDRGRRERGPMRGPLCVSSAANQVAPCRPGSAYIHLRLPGLPSNPRNRVTSATDVPVD